MSPQTHRVVCRADMMTPRRSRRNVFSGRSNRSCAMRLQRRWSSSRRLTSGKPRCAACARVHGLERHGVACGPDRLQVGTKGLQPRADRALHRAPPLLGESALLGRPLGSRPTRHHTEAIHVAGRGGENRRQDRDGPLQLAPHGHIRAEDPPAARTKAYTALKMQSVPRLNNAT